MQNLSAKATDKTVEQHFVWFKKFRCEHFIFSYKWWICMHKNQNQIWFDGLHAWMPFQFNTENRNSTEKYIQLMLNFIVLILLKKCL